MKVFSLLLFLFFYSVLSIAQNKEDARMHIQVLSSEKMHGRGYIKNGDGKAAKYIAGEFKKYGLAKINHSYYQKFSFPMNTHFGEMKVSIDTIDLTPVVDFVVSPDCPSIKGVFPVEYLPAAADTNEALFKQLVKNDYSGKFIVAPFKNHALHRKNPFNAKGVILPREKVYWWVSTGHAQAYRPVVAIQDSLLNDTVKSIRLSVESKFNKRFTTQNVWGMVEGRINADSVVVFVAHYDHLGYMGKGNLFPGANDNASGVAMVLNLAKFYSLPENKPDYSILFLLVGAEESGLLGSFYFVDNSPINLSTIKYVINFDMVGSGSEGLSIVNGKANPDLVDRIKKINKEQNYFPDVRVGGESCNSDHCPFHKKGVPALFLFTRGEEAMEYHNLKDKAETLPLTKFEELQSLIIEMVQITE